MKWWKCTDEFFDAAINRPAAGALVALLRRTPVTPNHLTLLAMLVGAAGGVLLGMGRLGAAASCILLSLMLDCADGQLARLRGGGTDLGRILDGVGDYVVGLSVHVGMLVYFLRSPDDFIGPWSAVALVAASGFGMALHAMILDYHKNIHLGRGVARPREGGLLVSVYNAYVRLQDAIAGTPETSPGFLRAIGLFGPTARMWIIAAMAIHPHVAVGGIVADLYILGLMVVVRVAARRELA